MRKKLIIANWKLNSNKKFISNYVKFLKFHINSFDSQKNIIAIAPPDVYLERVYKKIKNTNILVASQNVDINLEGAFTGETSILMLKDIGIKYVIVGHSERRLFHNEIDSIILKKFHLIKRSNLIPILCIGETKDDKKNTQTKNIIEKQLNSIFQKLGKSAFRNTVIAYEPIWAIGTGVSADPKEVQTIHQFIKSYIYEHDPESKNIIIQYGGSINSLNVKEFIKQPDIDGFLIGSASLKVEEFLKIIKIASSFYSKQQ